jgi:CheY-like chemotaxis protein
MLCKRVVSLISLLASVVLFTLRMSNQRILVVSAVSETAMWLSRLLAVEGATVDALTDGAAAFQRVWDEEYDVIVSEIGTPGIDGRDLYMAFQNTWPELTDRMVFVCGEPTPEVQEFVTRTGVPCLQAPVSRVALRDAVHALRAVPRQRALV